ncbi:hypothetical protein F441_00478 [Phytophthora nicotianae CJ01A1]|uniref:Uncharacterized protein n=6 Tax=Phytophthora nicotianae TaxID=4792 RepID=W2REP5_PHYN3|nr:hypothetical protein PPTG_20726 [Phytophthora nicotianae INRA-310]ETI57210.1 hypothetical protein F443_00479 [Phytophthora nicotianae P1569]ETK96940.1 hypothetical protein L915_00450 [Phytophthora nicotianae]ETO85953.1 hypothetical protein F444_00476 [Phytophthora nicotianae P1976]ETP26953.1 hypothetical protein F441_00478 [Phytophthora nicotianae CJ01A1]ETP54922.1 hypothetical protein F442_00467 [Phytophthora nicotianae P10297]
MVLKQNKMCPRFKTLSHNTCGEDRKKIMRWEHEV